MVCLFMTGEVVCVWNGGVSKIRYGGEYSSVVYADLDVQFPCTRIPIRHFDGLPPASSRPCSSDYETCLLRRLVRSSLLEWRGIYVLSADCHRRRRERPRSAHWWEQRPGEAPACVGIEKAIQQCASASSAHGAVVCRT